MSMFSQIPRRVAEGNHNQRCMELTSIDLDGNIVLGDCCLVGNRERLLLQVPAVRHAVHKGNAKVQTRGQHRVKLAKSLHYPS